MSKTIDLTGTQVIEGQHPAYDPDPPTRGNLIDLIRDLPFIPHDQKVNAGPMRYSFASLGQIAKYVRPIANKYGFYWNWNSSFDPETQTIHCTCYVRDTRNDPVSTASFSCGVGTGGKMSDAQKTAAALTYARRQALVMALGLSVVDADFDGADPYVDDSPTESEVADLKALAEEKGKDIVKMLSWLKADSLDNLTRDQFNKAINGLKKVRPE